MDKIRCFVIFLTGPRLFAFRFYNFRYTLCSPGAPKRSERENRQQYAGPLRRRLHPPHLHPCDPASPRPGRRNDGEFHGSGHVRKIQAISEEKQGRGSYPDLSPPWWFILLWVSVRVKQKPQKSTRQNYSQNKAKSSKINRFQRIFGAAGQIRTADLILTN